ncbi:contractile injection system tape measure protein [Chitinimonas naiadis]
MSQPTPRMSTLANETPNHLIETLLWQCQFRDQRLANALQSRLGQFLRGPALATMSALFERISPPEEVWHIDSLEIDLGVLQAEATPEQWADCLAQQLWTSLLRQRQALDGPSWQHGVVKGVGPSVAVSAAQHDLELFLFYLQNGHLPWSANAMAGRDLANWLVRLAGRTGPRLWMLLQQLQPGEYVLERLSRIAPFQGLQALLAVRHRELADSLLLLDDELLTPLLAKGRLSAYQAQQLQQAWRVAGLHALWGRQGSQLSAERLQRLIETLGESLAKLLGQGWRVLLAPVLTGNAVERRTEPASEFARMLLESLTGVGWYTPAGRLGGVAVGGQAGPTDGAMAAPEVDGPFLGAASQRLQDVALARLDAALSGSQQLPPGLLLPLLEVLAIRNPAALQAHLHHHVLKRSTRRSWLVTLGPQAVWMLMQQLASKRTPATLGADEAPADADLMPRQVESWNESLRQFALAGIQQPAWQGIGGGVSALQTWLMDYTLRYLAMGHALPQDHIAWQRLWQQAMAELAPPVEAKVEAPASETMPGAKPLARLAPAYTVVPTLPAGAAAARPVPRPARPSAGKPAPREAGSGDRGRTTTPSWKDEPDWPEHLPESIPVEMAADHVETTPASVPVGGKAASMTERLAEIDALLELPSEAWGPAERLQVSALLEDAATCEACITQLPPARRWQLLSAQFPLLGTSLRRQSELLVSALGKLFVGQPREQVERSHWHFLFDYCFVAGLPPAPAMLARRYAMYLRRQDMASHGAQSVSLGRWRTRLADALDRLVGGRQAEVAVPPVRGIQDVDPTIAMCAALRKSPSVAEQWEACHAAGQVPQVAQPARPDDVVGQANSPVRATPNLAFTPPPPRAEAAPIWLSSAGLVILAGYCQRLFAMLGLIEDDHFVDGAAQVRAVHCLGYLLDGHSDGNESDWVLHKLLCAVPLARPVPPCEGLDEPTRETLDGLLNAVIAHWKILGNTTADGLRETFLRRTGRLTSKTDDHGKHWQLKVQTGPFDMLLDQLPWSYATIRLPWMPEVLYVDWR